MCKEIGFEYLLLRRFTQDPLENTIGALRDECCGNNRKPTVPQFQAGFTSKLLYHLEEQPKSNRNCEQDENTMRAISELFKEDLLQQVFYFKFWSNYSPKVGKNY